MTSMTSCVRTIHPHIFCMNSHFACVLFSSPFPEHKGAPGGIDIGCDSATSESESSVLSECLKNILIENEERFSFGIHTSLMNMGSEYNE
jgi:hypothetical protein